MHVMPGADRTLQKTDLGGLLDESKRKRTNFSGPGCEY